MLLELPFDLLVLLLRSCCASTLLRLSMTVALLREAALEAAFERADLAGLILHNPLGYDGLDRVSQSVLPALFREELDRMLRRLPSCRHLDAFRTTDQDVERAMDVEVATLVYDGVVVEWAHDATYLRYSGFWYRCSLGFYDAVVVSLLSQID